MGLWPREFSRLRIGGGGGAPRRDKSPSQGWGHRKGPDQWSVERQAYIVLVGGSLALALGESLPRPTRVRSWEPQGSCVGGSSRPGVCVGAAPLVPGLSNRRNCFENASAALAQRPVISPWHVCKC